MLLDNGTVDIVLKLAVTEHGWYFPVETYALHMNIPLYYQKDYIYLDGNAGYIHSGVTQGNQIILTLSSAYEANTITYLPNRYYNNTSLLYKGPWIKGANDIGALSFYSLEITSNE